MLEAFRSLLSILMSHFWFGFKSWDLCFHFIAKVYFQMLSVYHVWFSIKLRQKKEKVRTILVYIIISVVITGLMFGSFVHTSTALCDQHYCLAFHIICLFMKEYAYWDSTDDNFRREIRIIHSKDQDIIWQFPILNWFYLGFLSKAEDLSFSSFKLLLKS